MKTRFTQLLGVGAALLLLASCAKDEDKVMIQPSGGPALTASSTSLGVLAMDSAAKPAVTYSWTAPDYGYSAAVTYTLQLDKKGDDFKAPVEFTTTATRRTLTVAELNTTLLTLGVVPGTAGELAARVKADVTSSAAYTQLSDVASLTASPYLSVIAYPSLYVPGAYQGWAPDKAPAVASPGNNGTYEGYVDFAATSAFKFTSLPAWSGTNYGLSGTIATDPATKALSGALSTDGNADNLAAPAGYYRLVANVPNLTWTATPTTWAVIGSATPGGWDSETPLTYNPKEGTWSAVVPLSAAGEMKFRANNAWDINFGDTKADGILDLDAPDNIKGPAAAGPYTVTLDLSHGAGNYTYSVRKN